MAASGSDVAHHIAFIEQSERRRFRLISYLNQLHTEQVLHHDDKNQRLEADFWKNAPRPTIQLAPLQISSASLITAIAVLLLWLLAPLMLLLRIRKHT
jgi:ABC-2 type transport system permease protein